MINGMMCRINSGATKIWLFSTFFASTSAVGTLFDCSFTMETGFSGNGKCSLWMNETASRRSALHPSVSQTASSAARVAATCSKAKKWYESGRHQRQSRDQQQDQHQLAKAGFIEMSVKL